MRPAYKQCNGHLETVKYLTVAIIVPCVNGCTRFSQILYSLQVVNTPNTHLSLVNTPNTRLSLVNTLITLLSLVRMVARGLTLSRTRQRR